MTLSYCPKCNKDQPAVACASVAGADEAHPGSRYYECAVCRTPVGAPPAPATGEADD
jgi:hypothetical protein